MLFKIEVDLKFHIDRAQWRKSERNLIKMKINEIIIFCVFPKFGIKWYF